MGSLQVDVTSRELIKPSSPTSPHLKTLQLSFLDQFSPPMYIPLLFFYQNDPAHNRMIDSEERSVLLKNSLSDVLVHFYPLAGRVQGNTSIDCNDEGVEFCEANVSSNLLEVIEKPNVVDLRELLAFEPIAHDRNIVLGVQVNNFSCGGVAISVCISHKIADGTAAVDFLRAWATMARGVEGDDHVVAHPKFDGASYFPPIDYNGIFMPESLIYKEKLLTRRFVFDKGMLDALKQEVVNTIDGSPVKDPTRVEVVSAFIWKSVMESTRRTTSGLAGVSRAIHAVNLRERMAPHIPKDSFGNFWWIAITDSSIKEESKHGELVQKLREAIKRIDENHITKLQDTHKCVREMEKDIIGIAETCRFTSWSRLPVYEVNFGWGKPTRVCTTTLPFRNTVTLLSTRCGQGIEAWVNMVAEDLATLQRDVELLSL